MKIVIAPDSFKESLPSDQVARAIQSGFMSIFPKAEYHFFQLQTAVKVLFKLWYPLTREGSKAFLLPVH